MQNPLRKIFAKRGESMPEMTKEEAYMLSNYSKKEREYIEFRLGIPVHKFTDYTSYLETGHKRVWATFRACSIIASIMVSATFKVRREGMGIEVSTDRFGWFLKRPNPYDSWEDMMTLYAFHMELTGSVYWLKDEVDMLGQPSALYPLLPQNMRIVPDRFKRVAKYAYHVNGREILFDPEEIVHFRNPHPTNLLLGMGSIEPSESLYNDFINKNTLMEKFLENGAQISGILSKKDASEDEAEWEAFRRKFEKRYGGTKNAGKTAMLSGEWSYTRLGMTMMEMQSLERDKWTVEQIFINHGIPLSVAGIDGAANFATAKSDEINVRKYKIVPMIDQLVGKLNQEGWIGATREGAGAELVYELAGLIDLEQLVKEYKPLVEIGAMTLNEMRAICNLPEIDNPLLDQFYVNSSRVPLEIAGLATPEPMPDPSGSDPDPDAAKHLRKCNHTH